MVKLTQEVNYLVYYPSIVLAIIIFGRLPLFANWQWPWTLWVTLGLYLGSTVFAGDALRKTAEHMRSAVLERLNSSYGNGTRPSRAELKTIISKVEDERRGAFASLLAIPATKAILIPWFGFALTVVLDFLAKNS